MFAKKTKLYEGECGYVEWIPARKLVAVCLKLQDVADSEFCAEFLNAPYMLQEALGQEIAKALASKLGVGSKERKKPEAFFDPSSQTLYIAFQAKNSDFARAFEITAQFEELTREVKTKEDRLGLLNELFDIVKKPDRRGRRWM